MKSMTIPVQWDTVSSPPRTRSNDAAKSSFQREQMNVDCQVPPVLPWPHPLLPPGKAPPFKGSAQGRKHFPELVRM